MWSTHMKSAVKAAVIALTESLLIIHGWTTFNYRLHYVVVTQTKKLERSLTKFRTPNSELRTPNSKRLLIFFMNPDSSFLDHNFTLLKPL
jgi:hypothetical protein